MISPEDVCANIERVKDSERLSFCLDRMDINKINENSHGLLIKSGIYKGATLLLCALTKARWNLIKALIAKANIGAIDVYASLHDSDLTVLSFIPDYLMCEVIQKAKEIKVNSNWRTRKGLLYDVLMGKEQDILYALLSKGLVDLELLENYKNNDQLKDHMRYIINKYLITIRHIGMLPHAVTFNSLMELLSNNEWLFDAHHPNSKDVTFKEQIINRLKLVSQKQLREFYKRFSQFKPEDFQIEEPVSAPPILPPAAIADTPPLPQQNGVEHKKELSLSELLYQGKHEILIERLQKGEIAFELFEPFVTDTPANALIHYNCKNVIEVCLKWRALMFELPKISEFQELLKLFENNSWLFTVLDASNKKSLLELTKAKLQFRNKKQLEQFNEKFPNCDILLNQKKESELPNSEKEHPVNGAAQKDDELKTSTENSSELKKSTGEIKDGAITIPQAVRTPVIDVIVTGDIIGSHTNSSAASEQRDATQGENRDLTVSADQPSRLIPKIDDEFLTGKTESNGASHVIASSDNGVPPNNTSISDGAVQEAKNEDVSVGKQLHHAIADYMASHIDGVGPKSLIDLSRRHQAEELRKAHEEFMRKKQEEAAPEKLNAHENRQLQTNDKTDVTTSQQSPGVAVMITATPEQIANNQPKKDLQQFFAEQKTALEREIYVEQIIAYDDKKSIINRVKEIFSYLFEDFKDDNKNINQSNRNDLLDVICEFYRNISAEEHKKKINIHSHPTYDRFFRKTNTHSWQEMVKEIRDKSLDYLLAIAVEQFKSNADKAVSFLNSYINEPLFSEHRSNVAICRIGDTNAVKTIKGVIVEYDHTIRKTKPHSA